MAHLACGFQTIEHTADIGIRAWGKDAKGLFVEAARGLFSLMADLSNVEARERLEVKLTAENEEELLFVWLKELLFIFDTKHLLLSEFQIRNLESQTLSARVSGERISEAKHVLGREVKAVTRHQFRMWREGPQLFCEVIFDI